MVNIKAIMEYALLISLMLGLSGCLHLPPYRMARKKLFMHPPAKPIPVNTSASEHTITVWIHGTRLATAPLTTSYVYSHPGLHPMNTLKPCYHLRQLADALCQADPIQYPRDNFYIFGWSGKLNAAKRREAARNLYESLSNLITSYKVKFGVMPKIRLVTHSHGGNVALCLPEVKDSADTQFTIDQLILLACPVQEKTMHAVHKPLFNKIYALYSSLDMLQILAPQFFYRLEYVRDKRNRSAVKVPLFSSRRFHPDPKLAQIKIKINGHAVFHTFFTTTLFASMLPRVISDIDAWQKEKQQYPLEDATTRRLLSIHTR